MSTETSTTHTAADVLVVEYYDQLPEDERLAYREATDDQVSAATRAEFDRIDAGLKPHCLS